MSTEQDQQVERLLRTATPAVGPAPVERIRSGARTRRRRRAVGSVAAATAALCGVAALAVPLMPGMPGGRGAQTMADHAAQDANSMAGAVESWRLLPLPASATDDVFDARSDAASAESLSRMSQEVEVVWEGGDLVLRDACLLLRVRHHPALPERVRAAVREQGSPRGVDATLQTLGKDLVPGAACFSALGLVRGELASVDTVAVLRDGTVSYLADERPVLEVQRLD